MRFHGGSIMLLISMFLISCDKKETLSEVVERGLKCFKPTNYVFGRRIGKSGKEIT